MDKVAKEERRVTRDKEAYARLRSAFAATASAPGKAAGAVAAAARELRPLEIVGLYETRREALDQEVAGCRAEVGAGNGLGRGAVRWRHRGGVPGRGEGKGGGFHAASKGAGVQGRDAGPGPGVLHVAGGVGGRRAGQAGGRGALLGRVGQRGGVEGRRTPCNVIMPAGRNDLFVGRCRDSPRLSHACQEGAGLEPANGSWLTDSLSSGWSAPAPAGASLRPPTLLSMLLWFVRPCRSAASPSSCATCRTRLRCGTARARGAPRRSSPTCT